jgi:sec-independent protein translocase protein TatA
MFETLGAPELLIILVIVVLLFGAGRVGRLGKDLGTSVKEFRRAIKDDDTVAPTPVARESAVSSPAVSAAFPAETATPLAAGVEPPRTQAPSIF